LNPKSKILSWEEALSTRNRLKEEKKLVVFTNGCFDILHAGHASYLLEARKMGDFLFVGLNSDSSVKKIKGEKRPVIPQNERAFLLASLSFVDAVIIFDDDTPLELIRLLLPDILVKGADWSPENIVGRDVVEANGGCVKTVPLVEGLSTSNIIEKILKLHDESK